MDLKYKLNHRFANLIFFLLLSFFVNNIQCNSTELYIKQLEYDDLLNVNHNLSSQTIIDQPKTYNILPDQIKDGQKVNSKKDIDNFMAQYNVVFIMLYLWYIIFNLCWNCISCYCQESHLIDESDDVGPSFDESDGCCVRCCLTCIYYPIRYCFLDIADSNHESENSSLISHNESNDCVINVTDSNHASENSSLISHNESNDCVINVTDSNHALENSSIIDHNESNDCVINVTDSNHTQEISPI